jgi:hypothetical protein
VAATVETAFHKEACSLISLLCMKHFSPLEIYCQLTEVCDDGTVRVQDVTRCVMMAQWECRMPQGVWWWHIESAGCHCAQCLTVVKQTSDNLLDICMNATWVEELIWGKLRSHKLRFIFCTGDASYTVMMKWKWLFIKSWECYSHDRIFKVMPRRNKYITMLGGYE